MKKLFTGLLALGVLMMGMASLAQAGNVSATDPVALAAQFGTGNVSVTTLGGLTVTVYRPSTNTAIANNTTPTTALIPSAVRGSLSYNSGALLTGGALNDNSVTDTTLAGILNGYAGLYTVATTSAGASVTTSIKTNSAWKNSIDQGSFVNLFTPGALAFNTNSAKYLLTSYVIQGTLLHAYNPSQLAVYKFIPDVAGVNNRNSVQRYTLRTSTANITGTTDGEVWFTTDAAGVSLQPANSAFSTASTTSYYMWVVLKDGGSFDLDGAVNGVVIDPPTVSPAPSSGSSDSGCVYNPAAGFSLEWLLLVLPALGAVVARIRRK